MLASLTIRNVVLIDQLLIEFAGGFCALTGETGAGKSILLDSLGLALGARADAGLVRKGADHAAVSAEFHILSDHPVLAMLAEQGIEGDTALVLRRILNPDGRSRAFINDQPVSVGLLKQAGDMLVEIHGQFDTQGLLDPKTHRALLDAYAGVDTATLEKLWGQWRAAQKQLQDAQDEAARAQAEEDYLRHVVAELDELAPQAGEEEQLAVIRDGLKHRDQTLSAFNEAWQAISGEDGAELLIARALRGLEKVAERVPDGLDPVIEALDRAGGELQDAVAQLESLTASLEDGEHSLESVEDRLYALRAAARKHDCRPDDLPEKHTALAEQLSRIDGQADRLADLESALERARTAYVSQAEAVSARRVEAAARLDGLVAAELPPLKLEKARFRTLVERMEAPDWGPAGIDRVQFMVATNPGAAPGPLNRIASGGEMSRFMLALKVVMADADVATSYIFDEVDSGIGGATADAVGERLARLARSRQILVVTHAPQVAARAGHHWIVMKQGNDEVKTTVIPLAPDARREEIARMLSGAAITTEARAAAQKLLDTGT